MSDDIEEIEERGEYTAEDLLKLGAKWMERIRNAEKREDTWLKDAEAAETAYLCRTDEDASGHVPDFNILHSNVETIVPSIYNSTPVPDIRPRHNNTDPIGKTVADMLERTISAQIDDGRLDCEIEKAAQDAFVAGRGVVRIKLDADDAGEKVVFEVVSWKDYREGPAKRWSDVPWVAFRHTLSHEMLEKFSDQELVQVQASAENSEDGKGDVCIWEIWCRDTGHVYFIADDNNKVLKIEDDPLQLRGFFPMPEPVQPITGTSSRTPVCPYVVYKKLAEELDRQTRRINAIINGLKVKGIIAADAEGIEQLADADDNELIPIGNIENLVAAGGLDKAIMWWPLQTAIAVLKELYVQREQTKQTIYEITGISDIVRGASKSNETATAQQIKTEWGSLRIKKMQRMIERQVRDLFVLAAEIVAQLFSPQTIQAASGIPLSPEVMPLLQQPLNFYRIDVESDSTVRADATRNKQEMGEFLTGTANFFSAMAPVVQADPSAAGPVADIYSAFARQFNLGKQAEDALEQFSQMAKQAAQEPRPNPAAEAAQMEAQAKQAEIQMNMQAKQAELQLKAQEQQMKIAAQQAEMEMKRRSAEMDAQIAASKQALEEQRMRLDQARFGLEVEKAEAEGEARASEMLAQTTQSGEVLSEALGPALQGLLGEIQKGQEMLAQMIQQSNQQIVAAMMAPKEVIRDDSGRPIGVRPVQQQQVN